MKDWFNKNKTALLVSIIIVLIIILIILGVFLYKKNKYDGLNNYRYNEAIEELPGSKKYTNSKLKSSHCLDNICIEDVVFHYTDTSGRVDYTVYNKSSKKRKGYLKMVFKEQTLIIAYDLDGKSKSYTSSHYEGFEIKNKNSYTLKKLSEKEISEIIKK